LGKQSLFFDQSGGSWREITRAGGKSQEPLLDPARPTRNFDPPIQASRRQAVSDDNLDALRQDKASDPNVRRLTQDEIDAWVYEDSKKPITKREGQDIVKAIERAERKIVDAINAIHTFIYRSKHGAETNKLLAEINAHLNVIKWSIWIIAGFFASKLLFG
jgi:hypothetical protein